MKEAEGKVPGKFQSIAFHIPMLYPSDLPLLRQSIQTR